ncbi:nitroreductase family deazaflavin-dependent oxidoreductase [Pedococcus sp. 5OH_020]|uniref:nitroreductase family deazaflavin-dependent oxidoreductase n=1 Tax=Pedococcus sp. 5OH_020 TaxID=2989814 RepID=UPI0022E9BD95|nr:nitroreductase family deazaflavin-dependent oxidoreductase [Pedococcus sp. 5OH_020]
MSSLGSRVQKTLWRFGSTTMVWLYRKSGGRVGGRVRGLQVVLLTVAGRKSGQPRTAAVSWFPHGEGHIVVGSAGGLPQEPQWFKNLRHAESAQVQVGRETFAASVRVLEGEERDRVWRDVVLARAPSFAQYEVKGRRTIPLAELTRTG